MRKIKIAIIGLGHVHTQGLYREFNQYADEVEWLGMADMENTPADKTARHIELNAGDAKSLRLVKHYGDLLAEGPDLVLCGSGIADHREVGEVALRAGASVILEKPMAMCFEDASALYQAHLDSPGELIVNWPVAWFGVFVPLREPRRCGSPSRWRAGVGSFGMSVPHVARLSWACSWTKRTVGWPMCSVAARYAAYTLR